jgi:hypothetical protein
MGRPTGAMLAPKKNTETKKKRYEKEEATCPLAKSNFNIYQLCVGV